MCKSPRSYVQVTEIVFTRRRDRIYMSPRSYLQVAETVCASRRDRMARGERRRRTLARHLVSVVVSPAHSIHLGDITASSLSCLGGAMSPRIWIFIRRCTYSRAVVRVHSRNAVCASRILTAVGGRRGGNRVSCDGATRLLACEAFAGALSLDATRPWYIDLTPFFFLSYQKRDLEVGGCYNFSTGGK